MVWAEVATAIHGFFWTLYHILQISAFVGRLLFQGICWTTSVALYCSQSVSNFLGVVYEDNRYLLEDARAMLVGLPELIYENLYSAYNVSCRLAESIQRTLDVVLYLPMAVVGTAKQGFLLFGKAVWMLVALPFQLLCAVLLALENECYRSFEELTAWLHYLVMVVPVRTAAGLALAAFVYFNPERRHCWTKWVMINLIAKPLITIFIYILFLYAQYRQLRSQGLLSYIYTKCSNPFIRGYRILSRAARLWIFIFMKCFILIIRGFRILSNGAGRLYDREIQPFFQTIARIFIIRSTHPSTGVQSSSPKRVEGPILDTCILCEENLRSVAFVPCGHICACLPCARNLSIYDSSCPICRTHIERNLNIYI